MLPLVEVEELILMMSSLKACYKPYADNKSGCKHKDCDY